MQTDTTAGPLAVYRHAINTALDDIRRHTEEIERVSARNTKRAEDIAAVISRLREGSTTFETETGINKMSMAALMIGTEAGDVADRCAKIREAHATAGMAMIAFEKAELPRLIGPGAVAGRRILCREYHHGKISEADWQTLVQHDPALVDVLRAMRQPLPKV